MKAWKCLLIAAMASSLGGCAYTTSAVPGNNTVNGETWYVRSTGFAGLVFAADIFYCPPSTGGHPTCKQAQILEEGEGSAASGASVASDDPPPNASVKEPEPEPEPDEEASDDGE